MGRGGTGGTTSGLLPLDLNHPDSKGIFRTGNIEEDYVVEKEPIARGKFASVRLARHRTSGEIFAAKFVRRRRRAANLEEEARHEIAVLLLGRGTPNIVHLHQVYETRSEYVIVLEFGEGGDLQRLLDDRGRLQEKTVRDLLRQVLNGLGFLHQKRVAHLDIKPQNLVLMSLTPEEGVKLVDFGLSRVIHEDTELTQIMGTPDYVAPEVINFEAVGLATDMWSIGVLTYVLLSGYTPFGGDTDQETFVNITQGDFDFPEEYFGDTSDQAKEFISGLLLKSPNQRFSVDQCAAHPWLSDLFDPHRLSQLSEADSADSGYSTDLCSGSPPSPGMIPNGYVSDLCQFSIPEEQQITHSIVGKSYQSHRLPRLGENEIGPIVPPSDRRPRLSSGHLSVNVLDCLQGQQQRPQSRSLRRSSLVIPRHTDECDLETHHNNTQFYQYDENQNKSNSLYLSDNILGSKLTSTPNLNKLHQKEKSKPSLDQNSLLNLTRPWNNLCYGSYSRALNQLNSPSPKKTKPRTNLGLRPELSYSMFELKPDADYNSMMYSEAKPTKYELRKSKSELRGSKRDLRNSNYDFASPDDLRGSKRDLRNPNYEFSNLEDVRSSKRDLRNPNYDFTNPEEISSKRELRTPNYDFANSEELRCSKRDLRDFNIGKIKPETEFRNSKNDLRTMKYDLDMRHGGEFPSHKSPSDKRTSKSDLKSLKQDLKSSRNDLRNLKSDQRSAKHDLYKSPHSNLQKSLLSPHHFASIPYLNMSLSRLDIAHETLNDDESSEERDIVPGDCTLPRRFSRSPLLRGNTNISPLLRGNANISPLLRGNSFHMSFRKPKKRDSNI